MAMSHEARAADVWEKTQADHLEEMVAVLVVKEKPCLMVEMVEGLAAALGTRHVVHPEGKVEVVDMAYAP